MATSHASVRTLYVVHVQCIKQHTETQTTLCIYTNQKECGVPVCKTYKCHCSVTISQSRNCPRLPHVYKVKNACITGVMWYTLAAAIHMLVLALASFPRNQELKCIRKPALTQTFPCAYTQTITGSVQIHRYIHTLHMAVQLDICPALKMFSRTKYPTSIYKISSCNIDTTL